MSSDIPAETAAALQAARQSLQNRDFDAALATLQQAVANDQSSRELYELLGVAYTRKGMVPEGIEALTAAVTLDPSNVTSRINLAVALHRAGLQPEAAVQLREARTLDPANEKARQLLQSLQAQGGQTPPAAPPYNPPTDYSLPTDGDTSLPSTIHPPQPQLQGRYGQSYPYGMPPSDYLPPGVPQGYGRGPYGGGHSVVVPDDPEGWSPVNIGPVLTSPTDFFQRQRGQQGLLQPMGYAAICFLIFWVLMGIHSVNVVAAEQHIEGYGKYGGLFIAIPLSVVLTLVCEFVVSGIFHLFCKMFGGKSSYAGTFRAHVYATTPFYLLATVNTLISMLAPDAKALGGFFVLVGALWSLALLIIGLRHIHTLREDRAVGAVVLPIFLVVVAIVLYSSLTA